MPVSFAICDGAVNISVGVCPSIDGLTSYEAEGWCTEKLINFFFKKYTPIATKLDLDCLLVLFYFIYGECRRSK
ncbi:hypothetical protein KQX54_010523 [Cotesia glomerata]|uniref:Uncharacterized protein n=1 Tax=Cotesia glomerata TaxID=32391 RepID=A0AAV7IRR1_COTGL|nr:hypothetical protein KQX54_010523 [Cotesia glomerata]